MDDMNAITLVGGRQVDEENQLERIFKVFSKESKDQNAAIKMKEAISCTKLVLQTGEKN